MDNDNEANLGCDDHNKGVADIDENATNKNQKELCSSLTKMNLIQIMMMKMTILIKIMTIKNFYFDQDFGPP